MIETTQTECHERFMAFVRTWCKLLAQGCWKEACELLDEPNCYGISWTPESIRAFIEEDIYSPDTRFAREHPEGIIYTDPDELEPQQRSELVAFSDHSGYCLDYDLPLNGEWSDITAQFEFLKREHNRYAVILHDLHVL